MTRDTGTYLIPAINRLSGLAAYFAGASPTGSMVHVSLWESDAHAQHIGSLKETIVNARRDAEAVGNSRHLFDIDVLRNDCGVSREEIIGCL